MIIIELLITGGGKITCNRCQAMSKRTKSQCGRPALKGKPICNFHGGRSTGPRTPEGKERSRQARIKSGTYTKDTKFQGQLAKLKLAEIESIGFNLNVLINTRTRSPKPHKFKNITSIDEIKKAIAAINTLT